MGGDSSSKCKMTVKEKLIFPEFTQKMKNLEVKKGETAIFRVKSIGKPEATISWMYKNIVLKNEDRHRIYNEGDEWILEIKSLRSTDEGSYTCKATNSAGDVTCSANLTLLAEIIKEDIDVGYAPKFTKGLSDVECRPGQSVKFVARIMGEPMPEIIWLHNGEVIEKSDNIIMQTD